MPTFAWKGKNRTGQLQEGVLLADSRGAAAASLRRQQIQIMALKEKGREIPFLPRLPGRVSSKELSIFTRQFSVMLDAGLPLVQCLEILGEQQDKRVFSDIIRKVRSDVESGASLADSMDRHRAAFDELYVNMVAAGEAGGILDIIRTARRGVRVTGPFEGENRQIRRSAGELQAWSRAYPGLHNAINLAF